MDKVTSFNIPVNDMKRAKKFYGDIFGWVLTPTGMRYDYHTVTTVDSDEKNQPKEAAAAINGASTTETEETMGYGSLSRSSRWMTSSRG